MIIRSLQKISDLNDRLRQAQKMEAVGQLTGGIAHDFNNLLAGISGSLEMAAKRLKQRGIDDIARHVDTAMNSADRAASLTHRLLAFSRRQTLDPKPTDIAKLAAGMQDLIDRAVGPTIHVETICAPDFIDDDAFISPRRRLFLLRDDLDALGLSPDTLRAYAPPALHNYAEALGSLYVMEGSTLGGRVIQKNVARHLGFSDTSGCSYFGGYGDDTAGMWRLFLERLDVTPGRDAAGVVQGALATFASLEHGVPKHSKHGRHFPIFSG